MPDRASRGATPPLALVAWLCAVFVGLGAVVACYGPLLPEFARGAGVGVARAGLVISALFCGMLAAQMASALLIGRYGSRAVLVGALVAAASGTAVLATAGPLSTLLAASALLGVGYGLGTIGVNLLAAGMLPARPGFVVNLCNVCYGLGAAAGPLVVSARLAAGGAGRTVLLGGALLLALLAPVAFGVLAGGTPRPGLANAAPRQLASRTAAPAMPPLLVVFFLYGGIETGFAGWLATYSERSLAISSAQAALLTSQYWACYLGGRGVATVLSLRVRPDLLLAWTLAALVAGGVMLAAGVGHSWWTAVAVAVIGLATGPIYPQAFAVVAGGRAEGAARAAALAGTVGSLGAIALPWAMGQILEHGGGQPLALTMPAMAIVMVGALSIGRHATGRRFSASEGPS